MKNFLLFFGMSLASITLNAQSTISGHVDFYADDVYTYSWPISLNANASVTFKADFTLDQESQYFIIQGTNVTIDGSGHTVTIYNLGTYGGLVENAQDFGEGYNDVEISNIKIHSDNSTLTSFSGWIGRDYFSNSRPSVIIINCSSDGAIPDFGGGITGARSGCIVRNSHSSGNFTWVAGGIFGSYSDGSAYNCYSTGDVGVYCGGIFAYNCTGDAEDCYSTGSIGNSGGGIFGYTGQGNATRCYSTGNIADYGGGIAGSEYYGDIQNCYSSGQINDNGGGIVGSENYGNITDCYTSGFIASSGGGITSANNTGVVTNCFSEGTGVWNDANTFTVLTGTNGSIWTDVNWLDDQIPYRLASFDAAIYDPATENIPTAAVIESPAGLFSTGTYSIVSINDMITTMNPTVSINSVTGEITFTNSDPDTYDVKVAYTDDEDGSYQVSNYLVNILSTLPLTWRSFTVSPRGNAAWLQWSTSSEQNTRDFNVQHSINGSNWTTIGTMPAAGISSSTSNYSYLHADPVNGNNYYRIQQTDMDGKYSYSTVQNMKVTISSKSFSVRNTVVSNGVLQVEVKASSTLYLYNNDGKLIWQKQFNAGLQNIDCNSLSKGVYILKGKDAVEKIIVR